MAVTGPMLRDALAAVGAIGGQLRSLDELAAGANDALRQAPPGLTSDGAASWLGTQAQESDYFRTTREYAKNPPYAPWVGRTFDQLTHQEAYARFGAWCVDHRLLTDPATFTKSPGALEDYRWAWLGGVFYFEWRSLWPIANRGDHLGVSQVVNGGPGKLGTKWLPNGWTARSKMYDSFRRFGAALLPDGAAPTTSSSRPTLREGDVSALVFAVATHMNRVFPAYSRIDTGPGPTCRLGPQCIAALTEFQRRSGIPTDPPFAVAGRTWAALEASGFRG